MKMFGGFVVVVGLFLKRMKNIPIFVKLSQMMAHGHQSGELTRKKKPSSNVETSKAIKIR